MTVPSAEMNAFSIIEILGLDKLQQAESWVTSVIIVGRQYFVIVMSVTQLRRWTNNGVCHENEAGHSLLPYGTIQWAGTKDLIYPPQLQSENIYHWYFCNSDFGKAEEHDKRGFAVQKYEKHWGMVEHQNQFEFARWSSQFIGYVEAGFGAQHTALWTWHIQISEKLPL
ncbi:uncharacterized protein LACBIDRAFT_332247 [Laccaria bicolor S238N-H82]|uniref:Predicted protein n=1 Tax=Laccaria bicolor (strain S238N-H82 / ATCC MYA-4686) TaxID=486041 RepID=B0DS32_LACBS|nr:uncharacterized protein LACBIDRAFT_332247 [Laccaria bicolor S238N-H82]EDR02629.1 predicted protein [Laccaria bicolor S238N-H82]|eukprot:XP_001886673.1 predicted protein [Laccaria bicolor S238N-H82]